jgi:hypothetical protein
VAEQTITAPAGSEKIVFRFQLRPEKTGVLFYRLQVTARGELEKPPEQTSEATLANNEAIVTVDRGNERQRVLYVSGRPNWEYKFLHRAIAEDLQTQLVGLVRIARREAKFEFRGRAGESSNPLFRGFGNQSTEEVERYDQPVLIRLGVEDEFELRDGFPKTPEELFRYRAVIIDDLEAEFFTRDQMNLLQRFVSEEAAAFSCSAAPSRLWMGSSAARRLARCSQCMWIRAAPRRRECSCGSALRARVGCSLGRGSAPVRVRSAGGLASCRISRC